MNQKQINRRNFMLGSTALAAVIPFVSIEEAAAQQTGSSRSVLNMGDMTYLTYMWINHFQGACFATPGGFPGQVNSAGYPNTPSSKNNHYGGVFIVPGASEFAGPYVFTGTGSGSVNLNVNSQWTLQVNYSASSGGANYTGTKTGTFSEVSGKGSNSGNFTVTDTNGTGWYIVVSRIDNNPTIGPFDGIAFQITGSDPSSKGAYLNNLALYRQADENDFLAGNYFRAPWKQMIVNLNPSAIRFMVWDLVNGGNFIANQYRWSDRTPATYYAFGDSTNQATLLQYGATTFGSDHTHYEVAAVSGTPAAPTHGTIVQCSVPTDWSTPAGTTSSQGAGDISNITKATSAVITVSGTYHVGDVVQISQVDGMSQINGMYGTVTAVGSGTITVNINSSNFTAYSGSGHLGVRVTLNLGTWGDFQIVMTPWIALPISYAGAGQMGGSGVVNTFVFDKNLINYIDSGGNKYWGAWVCQESLNPSAVPFELQAQMITELEAMIIAQGLQATHGPINPWICIPGSGLLSIDPDYSSPDNYAVGAVGVMLNGNGGYAGIPSRCNLFVEFSNEVMNGPTYPSNYCSTYGWWRYGSAITWEDTINGAMLRACNMVNDINTAFPGNSRIHHVITDFPNGIVGSPRLFGTKGTTSYMNDADYPFGTSTYPVTHFYMYASQTYMDQGSSWNGSNLATNLAGWKTAGGFIALSAVTAGTTTNCTAAGHTFVNGDRVIFTDMVGGVARIMNLCDGIVSGVSGNNFTVNINTASISGFTSGNVVCIASTNSTRAANQESYCNAYMQWMLATNSDNNNLAATRGGGTNLLTYASSTVSALNSLAPGVKFGGYEGWEEMQITGTNQQIAFLLACKRSKSLATLMTTYLTGYHTAGAIMPPTYTEIIDRWGFMGAENPYPNAYSFATLSGGTPVEWSGVSNAWLAMQAWNNSVT